MFQFKRIRSRILALIFIPTLVIIVSIIWVLQHYMYLSALQTNRSVVKEKIRAVAAEIDKRNLEAITIPKIMALAQQTGLFGRRSDSIRYARQILVDYPLLQAAYFGYEPNADGNDASYLARMPASEASAHDSAGRFIPYWQREGDKLKLESQVNMEVSFYYQGNKNRFSGAPETQGIGLPMEGIEDIRSRLSSLYNDARIREAGEQRAMITEPYNYEGTYFVVEQTYPIVINGAFKGIAGVDRRLGSISAYVRAQKPYRTADFILVSRRGRIITATMDPVDESKLADEMSDSERQRQLKTKKIEDTPFKKVLVPLYKSQSEIQVYEDFVEDPVLKRPFLYAAARVPTGDWLVVMRAAKEEIMGPVKRSTRHAFLIAGAGVLIVVMIIFFLASSVAARIKRVVSIAKQVAGGDLTVKASATSADETGQLTDAVGKMTHDLNSLISQVQRSSVQVLSTATEISAASREQEKSVYDFGSSTNEIAVAARQISATSQELVKSVEEVNDVAQETAGLARDGRANLVEVEQMMQGLAGATDTISATLGLIRDKAADIGGVVSTITKVADQTNLLSLNAAIEAEKAGEHGAGFSVVAREIRRLADQTAVATLDIERTVREMQTSMATSVVEITRFTEQVSKGTEEAGTVNLQLGRIMEQVQTLPPKFEAVTEGMRSQSEGASQISNATSQLAEAAQRTQVSAQEFANASTNLQDAVQGLKQEVTRFSVER